MTPGYNGVGDGPFGSASVTSYHYNQIDDTGDTITFAQTQSDFAVLHLSRPFTGLGTFAVASAFTAGPATVTAYPGDGGGVQVSKAGSYARKSIYSVLTGPGLDPGSSGGPLWTTTALGPTVDGIVSTGGGFVNNFAQITPQVAGIINSWAAQDDASAGNFSIADTTTNLPVAAPATPYIGPVPGLQQQCIDLTADSINITARTDNWFLHSGSGTDAIAVHGGNNVLDGGTGSNFLVGAGGADTFFVDDRHANADIWSTFDNFHAGDVATVWGVTQAGFQLAWADQQGASGFTGLTLHATAGGQPEASLTIVGYTAADLSNGRLSVSFGTDQASGSPYLYIHAIG